MKKVIFVCLLSLSVCLSKPNQQQEAVPAAPAAVPSPNPQATDSKAPATAEHPQTVPTETQTANNATPTAVPPTTQTPNKTTATNASQAAPTPNEGVNKDNATKPAEKDNTTDAKDAKDTPKPADDKKVEPPKSNNETKPAVPSDKANNATNADNKDGKKNDTTTPKAEVVSPSTSTPVPVEAKSRAFDGPSFIGGIILTLGLLAIGFMGFKYYKNQTERNYHTL